MNAIAARLENLPGFGWESAGPAVSTSELEAAVAALRVPTVAEVEAVLPQCDCGSEGENIDAAICTAVMRQLPDCWRNVALYLMQ